MKIYTKTGDSGQTALFDGRRVDKDSIRVECYGTLDELNAFMGQARHQLACPALGDILLRLQAELFQVAGELATTDGATFPNPIKEDRIMAQEQERDQMLQLLNRQQQSGFILPGSTPGSAALHVARTVCRRAERRLVSLGRESAIRPEIQRYLNRLSDLLYAMARLEEGEIRYLHPRS